MLLSIVRKKTTLEGASKKNEKAKKTKSQCKGLQTSNDAEKRKVEYGTTLFPRRMPLSMSSVHKHWLFFAAEWRERREKREEGREKKREREREIERESAERERERETRERERE